MWSSDMNLEIKSYSNYHIDAIITEPENGFAWRYTGFYGHLDSHLKEESWKLISFLNSQYCLPWFCCGDFNEIFSMNEKTGGAQRSQCQMEGFCQVINNCCFHDLGYCGLDFTWRNIFATKEFLFDLTGLLPHLSGWNFSGI